MCKIDKELFDKASEIIKPIIGDLLYFEFIKLKDYDICRLYNSLLEIKKIFPNKNIEEKFRYLICSIEKINKKVENHEKEIEKIQVSDIQKEMSIDKRRREIYQSELPTIKWQVNELAANIVKELGQNVN